MAPEIFARTFVCLRLHHCSAIESSHKFSSAGFLWVHCAESLGCYCANSSLLWRNTWRGSVSGLLLILCIPKHRENNRNFLTAPDQCFWKTRTAIGIYENPSATGDLILGVFNCLLSVVVCVILNKLCRTGIWYREERNEKIQHFSALKSHALNTRLISTCSNCTDFYRPGIFTQNPVVKRQVNETVLLLKSLIPLGEFRGKQNSNVYIYICIFITTFRVPWLNKSRPLNLKEICYWGRVVGYFEDMSDTMEGLWWLLQP